MDKRLKVFVLERISNFYRFNQRNHRILEKIDRVSVVSTETTGIGPFRHFVNTTLHAYSKGQKSFFSEQVHDRINGVTAKQWDAFWTHCAQRGTAPGPFDNLARAIGSLALPGLDKYTLAHLADGFSPDVVYALSDQLPDKDHRIRVPEFLDILGVSPTDISLDDQHLLTLLFNDYTTQRDVNILATHLIHHMDDIASGVA